MTTLSLEEYNLRYNMLYHDYGWSDERIVAYLGEEPDPEDKPETDGLEEPK